MNVKLLTQSGAFDLVEVKKHLKIQIIIISTGMSHANKRLALLTRIDSN